MRPKPSLIAALKLRCPYCHESKLQAPGKWFEFAEGCPRCDYKYDRGEDGYFSGAPWMISYPITSVICFAVVFLMFSMEKRPSSLVIALVVGAIGGGIGVATHPYARAIWMYFDHRFHPLDENSESH